MRILILLCSLCCFTTPVHAEAALKRIILMQTMPVAAVLNHSKYFLAALAKLGYVEGENLQVTVLTPQGSRERAETMLREALRAEHPDLVVTSATMASQVAHAQLSGSDIPQLFFTVSDPVGAGLLPHVGQPSGALLTGKIHTVERRVKLDLAVRILGSKYRPLRIGIVHSSYPSAVGDVALLKQTAAELFPQVVFISHQIPYRPMPEGLPAMLEDVARAVKLLEPQVDVWWEASGPLGEAIDFDYTVERYSKHPTIAGINLACVEEGALFAVQPGEVGTGSEAAELAARILRGDNPAHFPVTPPATFELGLNLDTAVAMGVVPPSDILSLAGEHVFSKYKKP